MASSGQLKLNSLQQPHAHSSQRQVLGCACHLPIWLFCAVFTETLACRVSCQVLWPVACRERPGSLSTGPDRAGQTRKHDADRAGDRPRRLQIRRGPGLLPRICLCVTGL